MTTCLGKSSSFGLSRARALRKQMSVYVFNYFPFGFEGRIWDLIISVPEFIAHLFTLHPSCLEPLGLMKEDVRCSVPHRQVEATCLSSFDVRHSTADRWSRTALEHYTFRSSRCVTDMY